MNTLYCTKCNKQLAIYQLIHYTNLICVHISHDVIYLDKDMNIDGYDLHSSDYKYRVIARDNRLDLFRYHIGNNWKHIFKIDYVIPIKDQYDLNNIFNRVIKLIPFS